jgi:pyridoxal phosphate enzyme (YggS family)
MIGHLQSNKARDAVSMFSMIQSVDSLSLAEELNKRAEQAAKTIPILLEVNIVGEASKFGYKPEQLLSDFERLNALPRLEIHGLMTIPPWTPLPERVRPVFRRLRELKGECEQQLGAPIPHLSMGMSGDFEVAIEEGATLIRIGTALFGERRKEQEALKR